MDLENAPMIKSRRTKNAFGAALIFIVIISGIYAYQAFFNPCPSQELWLIACADGSRPQITGFWCKRAQCPNPKPTTPRPTPIKNLSQTVHPTLTQDETATWKTFTDNTFGISFQYPPDLEAKSVNPDGDSTPLKSNEEVWVGYPQSDVIPLFIYKYPTGMDANTWWLRIGIQKFTQYAQEFHTVMTPSTIFKPPLFQISQSIIDQQQAVTASGYVESAQLGNVIVTITKHEGMIYMFVSPDQLPGKKSFIISNKILSTVKFSNTKNTRNCVVGGCSGQLCTEPISGEGMASTCEFKAEYSCVKYSKCERQTNGLCGWTQTQAYSDCLSEYTAKPQ